MNWLITIANDADVNEVSELLREWGCELNSSFKPIGLAGGLQILEVEGPANLPERATEDYRILDVHPNSPMTYH